MNNKSEKLVDRMPFMSIEELDSYRDTTKLANMICSSVGISSIFLCLVFTNIYTLLLTAGVLYLGGRMAVGSDEVRALATSLIEKKSTGK